MPDREPPPPLPSVRRQVRDILHGTPSFRKLPADEQERLVASMDAAAAEVVAAAPAKKVAMPGFVEDLLKGTFEAVVDASIEQMKAYADLLDTIVAETDIGRIRERLARIKKSGSPHAGVVAHKLKWPP